MVAGDERLLGPGRLRGGGQGTRSRLAPDRRGGPGAGAAHGVGRVSSAETFARGRWGIPAAAGSGGRPPPSAASAGRRTGSGQAACLNSPVYESGAPLCVDERNALCRPPGRRWFGDLGPERSASVHASLNNLGVEYLQALDRMGSIRPVTVPAGRGPLRTASLVERLPPGAPPTQPRRAFERGGRTGGAAESPIPLAAVAREVLWRSWGDGPQPPGGWERARWPPAEDQG